MKKFFILSVSALVLFACSKPEEEPTINIDNKFVSISPLEISGDITSMHCFNTQEALLTTNIGAFWQTSDGGTTWTDTNLFGQTWVGNLHIYNDDFGFCSGNDTNTFVYKGSEWNQYNFPVKDCSVSSFYLVSENEIYATTVRGNNTQSYLVYTDNGGAKWDTIYSALTDFLQVLFLDSQTGFILTHNDDRVGLMKTPDGGTSWYSRIPSAYGSYFNGTAKLTKMLAIDNEHLIIIGRGSSSSEGLILTSDDGGENWGVTVTTQALNDIAVSSNNIYFVGDVLFVAKWPINFSTFGKPLNIINTWEQFNQETDFLINDRGYIVIQYHDVVSVQFINDNTGFIATKDKSMVFRINVVPDSM